MANKPRGYGMTADMSKKLDSKYDTEKEDEARVWIEAVLGEAVFGGKSGIDGVHEILKDGKILCRLANSLGAKLKINEQKMPFKQMENIGNFLQFAEITLGVAKSDLFQTVDLYEKSNMWNVICCIHAVGRRLQAKYSPEREGEAREWIEAVLGENVFQGVSGPDGMHKALKDGKILLKLANKLGGEKTPIKINEQKMAFKMMENIGNFLDYCYEIGCNKTDMFQTADLYDNANGMNQVIGGIHALGRKANATGKTTVPLGPKEAKHNIREFTEEQLKAGQNVIGKQMGPSQKEVASQSGDHFGRGRQVAGHTAYK